MKLTKTQNSSIRLSLADIRDGTAWMEFPPEGKVKLAHKAGAPWNEKSPKAELHELQREILTRKERTKIVHGGSRLGKSVLGGCEKCAVIAARYDHVNEEFRYPVLGLKKLFPTMRYKTFIHTHKPGNYRYLIETIWGSTCQGFSTDADDGAALLGKEFSRAVLGEGSHIAQEIYEKRIARAVDGWLMQSKQGMLREGGYVSIYTTPKEYSGCSAFLWEQAQKDTRKQPETMHYGKTSFQRSLFLREASVLENPFFDREVFEARKATLSKDAFEETYLGKMTFKTGRIYKEFSEERHVVGGIPSDVVKGLQFCVGFDTGTYFGCSLIGLSKHGKVYNLGEVYGQQTTIDENCDATKEMIVDTLGPHFGLEGETEEVFDILRDRIEVWTTDPASQHKMEIMDKLDVSLTDPLPLDSNTRAPNGKLSIEGTIDVLRELFKTDKLLIHENCQDTIDQLRKYVWKQQKAAGMGAAKKAPVIIVPKKGHDHLCDSLRFATISVLATGPLEEEPAPLSVKESWDQWLKNKLHGELKDLKKKAAEKPRWV